MNIGYLGAVVTFSRERARAKELAAALEYEPLSARPLRALVAELPRLLSADGACAFRGRERRLDFFHGAQMPAGIRPAYETWLATAPERFASYDPDAPDPRQRNVV